MKLHLLNFAIRVAGVPAFRYHIARPNPQWVLSVSLCVRRVRLSLFALVALLLPSLTGAQALPEVQVRLVSNSVVHLEWPITDGFTVLESSSSLPGGSNLWNEVMYPPLIQPPVAALVVPATNQSQFFRLRASPVPGAGSVTPPEQTVPPPPPNVIQQFADSIAFLYSGSNAVQAGVISGAIDPAQAGVVRGKVTRREGDALGGVRVSVLNHPEYGFTYTRADGMFDLAVNRAALVLDFQLKGYTAAQRPINALVGDYVFADPVALVSIDPVTTVVQFGSNAPAQIATSSVQTDADGTRSAVVVFPAATHATMVLADGSTQDCSGLTIRATEYTVGPNGPDAMPAPLPPSSGYTYCVALTADEAMARGARAIQFDQPVFTYVDNFLGFDTGTLVPSGYYDRQAAVWVPQPNGIVLQLVSVSNGVAQVDLDGDGMAEAPNVLATNQFTQDELMFLAAHYSAGHSLWRVPVSHFTDWDFNMDVDPANGRPRKPGDRPGCQNCDGHGGNGELNFQSRIFTEQLPLPGTPMSLHYSSARVPDYRLESEAVIPLTDSNAVPNLQQIELTMDIAGQHVVTNFPPLLNQSTEMVWDGADAYGRPIYGSRLAYFSLFYEFPPSYQVAGGGPAGAGIAYASTPELFGNYGQYGVSKVHRGALTATSVTFSRPLTIPDHRALGLGGWSLTPLHRYDPVGRLLYLGDGRIRRLSAVQAGAMSPLVFPNRRVQRIATASDGTLYLVIQNYQGSAQLFRVRNGSSPQALFAGFAGPNIIGLNGEDWSPADGKPANTVLPGSTIEDIATGTDGSVYIRTFRTIGRIDPAGIFHLLVGSGPWPPELPADGTPGRQAWAEGDSTGHHIAVSADGTVFFTAGYSVNGQQTNLLQRLGTDGRIYTIAGLGGWPGEPNESWRWEIGKAARNARLEWMNDLAVGPDGSVYVEVTGSGGIYRVTTGGTIESVLQGTLYSPAGLRNPPSSRNDEGQPAVSTGDQYSGGNPDAHSLRVGPDGTVFFYQAQLSTPPMVWKITPNGILQRVAGRASPPDNPAHTPDEDVSPLEIYYNEIIDLALDNQGQLVLVDAEPSSYSTVRFYGASQLRLGTSSTLIPSEDATELYEFDANGQHLRTFDGATGATNWTFRYDEHNLVTELQDVNGLVTRVQRDATGKPLAIVGPYGESTALALDSNGFLAAATLPGGAKTRYASSSGGLLLSITGPRGFSFQITYDEKGRVSSIADPAGGLQSITGKELPDLLASDYAYGGLTEYRLMRNQPDGSEQIQVTHSDGASSSTTIDPAGNSVATTSDGIRFEQQLSGDPRFGNAAMIPSDWLITLADTVTQHVTMTLSTALSNASDPFSYSALTNTISVNGQPYQFIDSRLTNGTTLQTATSPEGRMFRMSKDAKGLTRSLLSPTKGPVELSYDDSGRMIAYQATIGGRLATTSYTYDTLGRLSSVIYPENRTMQFAYAPGDWVSSVTYPDGTTAALERDSEMNLTSIATPGKNQHLFGYNSVDLMTNYTPPMVNGVAEPVTFGYDELRRLVSVQYPDGQALGVTYSPTNGLLASLSANGKLLRSFRYDPASALPVSVQNADGNSVNLGYQGPLLTNLTFSGAVTGVVVFQFGSDFKPVSRTIDDQPPLTFSYNADQILTNAGPLSISPDPSSGLEASNRLGAVNEERTYDAGGRLTNLLVKVNGSILWASHIEFESAGRITNRVEVVQGITNIFSYSYDAIGRLIAAVRNGVTEAAYTYDANGNRLSRNGETGVYDAQDRVTSYNGQPYSWSTTGQLTQQGSTTYTYDLLGALVGVDLPSGSIDYALDGAGRRAARRVNGAIERGWLWAGPYLVAELNPDSSVKSEFIYAGSRTPAFMRQGTNLFKIVADERGSVRFVINAADGTIAQQLDYDEFGRVLQDSAPGFQPFGFAGGLYDPATGLVRFGVRDYDSQTGRWTGRDPKGFAGGSLNLFAYLDDDPLNRTDPSGMGPNDKFSHFWGGSISGGTILVGGISAGLIYDDDGNVGIAINPSVGDQAGASASVSVTHNFNKGTIWDAAGWGRQTGFTGGEYVTGGADLNYNLNGDITGVTYNVGVGLEGFGGEIHSTVGKTYLPVGVNVFGLWAAGKGLLNFENPFVNYYQANQPIPGRNCP